MLSRKNKIRLLKIFSIFSVMRGYNIFVVVLAQYLASIFIFGSHLRALDVLLDFNLFLIILSSSVVIASGYIINNFYDSEKDLINRPDKSMLDRLVSKSTKFQIYFALNFLGVGLAWIVSWRAALFFSCYIFILWFYSHKLKKYPIIGNITAAVLAMLPFFGILMYFKNYSLGIFVHALFLYLIILIREMVKDLENIKGDLANDYQTIPVRFGVQKAKQLISVLTFLCLIPAFILIKEFEIGYMGYYFYFSMIMMSIFLFQLWGAKQLTDFKKLHLSLKLLILLGVISIALINPQVILHGKEIMIEPLL
ncbi:geranylgeranylglycerol-phosphate geranylgeranyltransferase [Paenimyroides ceti]